jgi:hypothetical protein
MKVSARAAWVAIGLGCVLGATAFRALAADGAPVEARAAFERMKSLAGEWSDPALGEGAAGKVVYKVTANGSAVMETLFPGTGHEMVTMNHSRVKGGAIN